MSQPLVSIIVPIYKVEPYLRRCLDSIVNQTYTNLEIILIDDGSPDNCPQICDEYAAKDKRIIVIHKENGGLSDARNAGLDICKGEYISFVDSDDWVDEKYIETLLDLAIKENVDIAIGEHEKNYGTQPSLKKNILQKRTLASPLALKILFQRNILSFILSWGKIYHKHLFESLRFPKGKVHEDEFTTYLIFNKATKIAYTSKILYYYFQRSNSIMGTPHPYDLLEAEENQFNFIIKNDIEEAKASQARLICWQILYIYSQEPNDELKAKLQHYAKYIEVQGNPFIHYFLLKLFCNRPYLYSVIRKFSPFLIRK